MNYKFSYCDDGMYGHVVDIVKNLNINDDGIHLDIACGFAAINIGLKKHGYNFDYVGIDANEETINYLKNEGTKAYCHTFSCGESDFEYIEKILEEKNVKLITVLDFLEHIPNPENFLKTLNRICKKHNALLIISVPNVCHRDIAFKMMEGRFDYTETGLLDKTHLSLFSAKRLQRCMRESGFKEIFCNDFCLNKSDQHFPQNSPFLLGDTSIYKCFNYIKTLSDPFATVKQFVRAYLPFAKEEVKEKSEQDNLSSKPFLSIITRTQGKRIEALTETLLCLTAQTNTDFEVLLMGHKLTESGQAAVEKVINELPSWMKEKIKLIKVDHGNRTTPLNVGFENANGEYISILDDDDIVFDNWVEEFYNLFKRYPRTILHAYSLKQEWEEIDYSGEKALRACGSPDNVYCRDFNLLEQVKLNFCPTMSYACPSYTFKKLGINFNEKLSTAEDWDFLMRTAFITGVSDSDKVTSVYRIWNNSENSYSQHKRKEWLGNEKIIKDYFNKVPIILPEGYAAKIPFCLSCEKIKKEDNTERINLYVDYGYGFSEDSIISTKLEKNKNTFIFEDFSEDDTVHSLRFDPGEEGKIWVSNINIEIITNEGEFLNYKLDDIDSNGLKLNDGILFLKNDPQIIIPLAKAIKIKCVKIKCNIYSEIPDFVVNKISSYKICFEEEKKENIFLKIARKIKHFIK